MTINVDRRIYSDDCVSKAAYSLADRYVIERSLLSDTVERLSIIPKGDKPEEVIKAELTNCLNDSD